MGTSNLRGAIPVGDTTQYPCSRTARRTLLDPSTEGVGAVEVLRRRRLDPFGRIEADPLPVQTTLNHPTEDGGELSRELRAQVLRNVTPTLYSAKELSRRVRQEQSFVTRVLARPKLWLIGDERALAA